MEKEIWKNIKDYEGLYQVSSFGRVKSLQRYYKTGRGGIQLLPERILKQSVKKSGYACITLCKNGKHTTYLLHRIVALAFLPNPNNYPQINHIDENPLNNKVSNIEWCTSSYNINYGNRTNKAVKSFISHRYSS